MDADEGDLQTLPQEPVGHLSADVDRLADGERCGYSRRHERYRRHDQRESQSDGIGAQNKPLLVSRVGTLIHSFISLNIERRESFRWSLSSEVM